MGHISQEFALGRTSLHRRFTLTSIRDILKYGLNSHKYIPVIERKNVHVVIRRHAIVQYDPKLGLFRSFIMLCASHQPHPLLLLLYMYQPLKVLIHNLGKLELKRLQCI
ncbi:hypothetical protein D1872_242380 [compost metagenome]